VAARAARALVDVIRAVCALGFGRITASETEAPNMLVDLV
jgi:hypothetical protein